MKLAYAMYVDEAQAFLDQGMRLVASLRSVGVNSTDIVVFSPSEAHLRAFAGKGVTTHKIGRFPGQPYCNKILPWQASNFRNWDGVCFCDCDLFFVERFVPPAAAFAARVVDRPHPPLPVLSRIFEHFGLPATDPVPVSWPDDPAEQTLATNFNGGFYYVETGLIDRIGPLWRSAAEELMHHPEFGPAIGTHADQVGMAIALVKLGVDAQSLPADINVPTHLPRSMIGGAPVPRVLHYHRHLTKDGLLRRTGIAQIDQAVERANGVLHEQVASDARSMWPKPIRLFGQKLVDGWLRGEA